MDHEREIRSTVGKHLVYGPDGSRRWAARTGKTYSDAYASLPSRLREICESALLDHDLGCVTIWLISEKNLYREPATADALIDLAVAFVRQIVSSELLARLRAGVELIGDIESLDQVRPGVVETLRASVPEPSAAAARVRILLGYNADKELFRALTRCQSDQVVPNFVNISARWCMPPVDVFLRTGQPRQMVNLSAYFPGIDRGRILTTSLLPQEFGKSDLRSVLDRYRTAADSIATATIASQSE